MSIRFTKDQIIKDIEDEVASRGNIVFHGFVGEYTTKKYTYLNLECTTCGAKWDTTCVFSFLNVHTGCPECRHTKSPDKMFPWVGETRVNQLGAIQEIISYDKHNVYYTCSECAKDPELFPSPVYRIGKGDWRAGIKQACGCGKSTRWSKEQYELLCERKSDERDSRYKFIGFTGGFKGCDTKVVLSCCKHGLWGTQSIEKYLSNNPRGCPDCARDSRKFGYIRSRALDKDNLYLIAFSTEETKFVKVGRSFDVDYRLNILKRDSGVDIRLLATYQGIHRDIYDLEQDLHYKLDKYHITPENPFGGSIRECFTEEILHNPLIKRYFNLQE